MLLITMFKIQDVLILDQGQNQLIPFVQYLLQTVQQILVIEFILIVRVNGQHHQESQY